MDKINLPPFYKGQQVVALKDIVNPRYNIEIIKGQIFTVSDLFYCCMWRVDVGVKIPARIYATVVCLYCRFKFIQSNIYWLPANLFAPVIENFQAIEFEKVLELERPLIGIN